MGSSLSADRNPYQGYKFPKSKNKKKYNVIIVIIIMYTPFNWNASNIYKHFLYDVKFVSSRNKRTVCWHLPLLAASGRMAWVLGSIVLGQCQLDSQPSCTRSPLPWPGAARLHGLKVRFLPLLISCFFLLLLSFITLYLRYADLINKLNLTGTVCFSTGKKYLLGSMSWPRNYLCQDMWNKATPLSKTYLYYIQGDFFDWSP